MLLKAPGAANTQKGPLYKGVRTEMRPRSTLQQDFKKAAEVMCQYVHINMRVTHTPCNLLAMTHYSDDLKYAMTSRSDLDAVIEVHKVEAVGKRRVVSDTAEYAASNAPAKHEPSQTQNC